jgi:3-oxoacyl-[acyl-carrier protein] reductase
MAQAGTVLTFVHLGLTRALCLEYRVRKVRVNALLPGWVESPMWDSKCYPHAPSPPPHISQCIAVISRPFSLANIHVLVALKPKLKEAYLQDTPLHRVAHPDEVADAAMFLAANQFANNCVLNLDGGLSAA